MNDIPEKCETCGAPLKWDKSEKIVQCDYCSKKYILNSKLKETNSNYKERSPKQLPTKLQPTFYPESPQKIFWLSLISGGLYDVLWFYRHWRHFKQRAIECKKLNLEKQIKYETDSKISPFWSAFFGGAYIVGTARRIRDRLRDIGSSQSSTGPWWAFWLLPLGGYGSRYEATENIVQNIAMLLFVLILSIISSWQITRLQIKANQSIILSNEMESIGEIKFTRWDILFLIFGLFYSLLIILSLILPPSY